jgi:hypothetical protein
MTSEGNGTNECSYDGSWTLGHIRNAEFTRDGIPTESDEARYRVKEGGNVLNRYDGPMQMNVTEGSAWMKEWNEKVNVEGSMSEL